MCVCVVHVCVCACVCVVPMVVQHRTISSVICDKVTIMWWRLITTYVQQFQSVWSWEEGELNKQCPCDLLAISTKLGLLPHEL